MILSEKMFVTTRRGTTHGPIKASPMWDNVFFSSEGYHWQMDGTLLGFNPGGDLDAVICSEPIRRPSETEMTNELASLQKRMERITSDLQQISTSQSLHFCQQKAFQILSEVGDA